MTLLHITVPGAMRGKGRPRFGTRGGVPRAYTDAKTASAESFVRFCATEQVGQPVLEGPLRVAIEIDVEVPRSWSQRKRAMALSNTLRPTGKPDIDNCVKLIADALNGIVWRDDSQIVSAMVLKRYAAAGESRIQIATMGDAA